MVMVQNRRLKHWLLRGTVLLGLAQEAPVAFGFAEDLCPVPEANSGWVKCSLEPCNAENTACESIAFLTTAASQTVDSQTHTVGARNTVHFDSTYYLAQAAGFSARDAYYIAAYDQAVDLKQFVLRGESGALVVDPADCTGTSAPDACRFLSRTIGGVWRNNFTGGGLFFHFPAPPTLVHAANGLEPDISDPRGEAFLYHVRRWAYGQGPLCVAGLTMPSASGDYASGSSCYVSPTRKSSQLVGRIPFVSQLGFLGSVDWTATLGEQTVVTDDATGISMPASGIVSELGADIAPLAVFGIYIHSLQDRISHYRCQDDSVGEGPRAANAGAILLNPLPYALYTTLINVSSLSTVLAQLQSTALTADPDFLFTYSAAECDQPSHAQRHTWETGVVQSTLPPENQTTKPVLQETYNELLHFAQFNRVNTASSGELSAEDMLGHLLAALEKANPPDRLAAMCDVARESHWVPLPEHCNLSVEDWEAESGKAMFADAASSSGGGSAPAAGSFTILWLIGASILALLKILRSSRCSHYG